MSPTLVILAAGLGSRFGGLKQMAAVGPAGQTILDYSLHDARRAGFGQVVFIIRHDFEEAFRARYAPHMGEPNRQTLERLFAFQELDALPPGFTPPADRTKPWGTGHALWCARALLDRPFAVINADDFYGADAFRRLAHFLQTADAASPDFAMVGYHLGHTLSKHGVVSRGLCQVNPDGLLTSIVEQTGLELDLSGGARVPQPDGTFARFPAETLVSMNCWAFTPAFLPSLDAEFHTFLRHHAAELKNEFYLPGAVNTLLHAQQATVRMLPTESAWFGVTYVDDLPRVKKAILTLHENHKYPEYLLS